MKTNIFAIPAANIQDMKAKFAQVGLESIHSESQDGWTATFYFSKDEEPSKVPWIETFSAFFGDEDFRNLIYFGAYVFEKDDKCFVISFGKTHFYIRPHCEHDFGIEMAKRIANERDIKQTASKKFAGKKKKEIKSYTRNSRLDIESGESIDYLQASINEARKRNLGTSGKFGSSILINPPVTKSGLGAFFTMLLEVLGENENFKLPRTETIVNSDEVAGYDAHLLTAIKATEGAADFTDSGHDLVGVDFIFSGNEKYTLYCWGYESEECESLDRQVLQRYIQNKNIADDDVFKIKIKIEAEGQKPYSRSLKESLDYIVDDENVMLSQGRWVRFNEDYLDQLNDYIDSIDIEDTEPTFKEISVTEGAFNTSPEVTAQGYQVADKDFSRIGVDTATQIEAWDLHKGSGVYAVKFGTAQKLGYVCDQANAVVEIIRNKANVKKLNQDIQTYCLWLGFSLVTTPSKISETKSVILKQKIEAWARKCREVGIEPRLKLSRRIYL
jgi:uncharacterized protein (TIGR04141 family)